MEESSGASTRYAMQQPIYDRMSRFIESHEHGIRCITTPTGSGKTHVAAMLFVDTFFASPDTRMVYVVPLRENRNDFRRECLAVAKGKGFSRADIERLDSGIFIAESQADILDRAFEDKGREPSWKRIEQDIKKTKKTALDPIFETLGEDERKYINLRKQIDGLHLESGDMSALLDGSRQKTAKALRKLKNAACDALSEEYKYSNQGADDAPSFYDYYQLHRDAWGWMELLWPSIQIPSKRIFIMTPEKLLCPEDTVVAGVFRWLEPGVILGPSPIAILDEADSMKTNFLGFVSENSAGTRVDPFVFLSKLNVSLRGWLADPSVLAPNRTEKAAAPAFNGRVDKHISVNSSRCSIDPQKDLGGIVNLVNAATSELYIGYDYKFELDDDKSIAAFMFPGYVSGFYSRRSVRNFKVLPKKQVPDYGTKNLIVERSDSPDAKSLNFLITRAKRMTGSIFSYIYDLAILFQSNYNNEPRRVAASAAAGNAFSEITMDQAVASVVNSLFHGSTQDGNEVLIRAIASQFEGQIREPMKLKDIGVGLNVWGFGPAYLSLKNVPTNKTKTETALSAMNVTPELVLAKIGMSYRTIMMSATMGIDTVANFEFSRFMNHIPELDIVDDTPQEKQEIKSLQDSINRHSDEHLDYDIRIVGIEQPGGKGVPLRITPSSEAYSGTLKKTWDSLCSKYFPPDDKEDAASKRERYKATKLWNLAEVMEACVGQSQIHAVLCIIERGLSNSESTIFSLPNAKSLLVAACKDKGVKASRYHIVYLNAHDWHENMRDTEEATGRVARYLKSGDTVFLVTTRSNAEAGKNIQRSYQESQKEDYIDIYPDGAEHDERRPLRCDWDAIYREKPTHDLMTSIDADEAEGPKAVDACLLEGMYQWAALYDRDEISKGELSDALVRLSAGAVAPDAKMGPISIRNIEGIGSLYAVHLIQSLGRLERTAIRPRRGMVFIDCELASAINADAAEGLPTGYLYSKTIDAIAAYQGRHPQEISPQEQEERRLRRTFLRAAEVNGTWMHGILRSAHARGYWTKREAESWAYCRSMLLSCPSGTPESGFDFYWHTPGIKFSEYACMIRDSGKNHDDIEASSIRDASVTIMAPGSEMEDSEDKELFHASSKRKNEKGWHSFSITEEQCGLADISKVPLLRDWWTKKRYALHFEEGEYHMTPQMARNIYMGALGEECLLAAATSIIDTFGLDLEVSSMPTENTEKFDFALYRHVRPDGQKNATGKRTAKQEKQLTGIYLDAKNWRSFDKRGHDAKEALEEAEEMLALCQGTQAVIVNIFGMLDEEYAKIGPLTRGNITTIPMLWGLDSGSGTMKRYDRGWMVLKDILEGGQNCSPQS